MNDFTKDELDALRESRCYHMDDNYPFEDALFMKLQSMIDNYKEAPWNVKKIAESHLSEASSLISHAMCLLDMKEE